MRITRKTKKLLLAALAALAAALAVAWVLAGRVPSAYRPADLTAPQRDAAARAFYRRLALFNNEVQKGLPFAWTVSEEEINDYLGAMDEIAAKDPRGSGQSGTASRAMARAGLSAPAVALDDGELRLMARSTRYDKVLSAGLRFDFAADGRLRVRVAHAGVGNLPLPAAAVRRQLAHLGGDARHGGDDGAGGGVEQVPAAVLAALDGQRVDPVFTWKLTTRRHLRITSVEIADGVIVLSFAPARPATRAADANEPTGH